MRDIEIKIRDYIDSQQEELITLASKLIKFNSENPPGDSKPITKYIEGFLRKENISSTLYKSDENMYNITAGIGHKKGKKLVFCGHTDVVPAGDLSKWDFDPFSGTVKEGWLHGRGASDMKAGLAGIIYATVILKRLEIPLEGEIELAIVPDEETGGELGVPWLLERNLINGDGCIIAEPSSSQNPTLGQKGSCWFKLTIYGEPGHGSLGPIEGKNAIVKAAKAIEKIKGIWDIDVSIPSEVQPVIDISKKYMKENEREEYENILERISVNIGVINGGTKANVIPDKCVLEVDCRLPFGAKQETVFTYLHESFKDLDMKYKIESTGFQSLANYTSPENPICLAVMESIESVTNKEAYGVLQWASSDARHFRDYNIPVLQYGPAYLPSIHGYNERVQVENVIECAKVYALTALRFLSS